MHQWNGSKWIPVPMRPSVNHNQKDDEQMSFMEGIGLGGYMRAERINPGIMVRNYCAGVYEKQTKGQFMSMLRSGDGIDPAGNKFTYRFMDDDILEM